MTYPTTPEFSAVNVKSTSANISSTTRSGRMQVRSIGAQKWSFSAKYNNMTREEFAPVYAYIMTLQGQLNSFDITPPVISDTSGTATGTVRANGAHSVGDNTIAIDGLTGTIKAGDFVKFAGHSKVYMVTAERDGVGTLTIQPALLSSVGNDEQVIYNDVPFKMRLENDVQEFGLSGFDRYDFEIDMIEVI